MESDGKKYRRNQSLVRLSKKSLYYVNTQETVRPVPVSRPRKSLSPTTTEVSPPNNMTTSDEQRHIPWRNSYCGELLNAAMRMVACSQPVLVIA